MHGYSDFLEHVSKTQGNAQLIQSFRHAMAVNNERAIADLNDDELGFTSFYQLFDEISRYALEEQLSDKKRLAAAFIKSAKSGSYGDTQSVRAMLKWVIVTGKCAGTDSDYLRKMDTAAGLLTSVYGDKSVLPYIVDELFFRYRKGLPYHYLARTFFEIRDPYSLVLVAERLRSTDQMERACSGRLLAFIPGIEQAEEAYKVDQFYEWLEDNGPFLWYKGETFDTTHQPTPYMVVFWAKYLGYVLDPASGTTPAYLTEKEHHLYQQFQRLSTDEQRRLADQSLKRRQQHRKHWQKWLDLPMKEQWHQQGGSDGHD